MKQSDPSIEDEVARWRTIFSVRTAAYVLAFAGLGSGGMAVTQMFGVAKADDLQALREEVRKVSEHSLEVEPRIEAHDVAIEKLIKTQSDLQSFLYADAAERIADKAAEPIRDAARSRAVWRATRERVLANLGAGRPARDGLPE